MSFKVGDWVTRIEDNCTKRILEEYENFYDVGEFIFDKDRFTYTLWEPKEGEWCWFKNNRGEPCLKRFLQMCPVVLTNYISKEGLISDTVEPFIGTLPTFIEDI